MVRGGLRNANLKVSYLVVLLGSIWPATQSKTDYGYQLKPPPFCKYTGTLDFVKVPIVERKSMGVRTAMQVTLTFRLYDLPLKTWRTFCIFWNKFNIPEKYDVTSCKAVTYMFAYCPVLSQSVIFQHPVAMVNGLVCRRSLEGAPSCARILLMPCVVNLINVTCATCFGLIRSSLGKNW
jgi:hypothetical protein